MTAKNNETSETYTFIDCVSKGSKKATKQPRDETKTLQAIEQMRKAIGHGNQHGIKPMDALARDAARHGIGLTITHIVTNKDGEVWDHTQHPNVTVDI